MSQIRAKILKKRAKSLKIWPKMAPNVVYISQIGAQRLTKNT